jgi:hypothetical protein
MPPKARSRRYLGCSPFHKKRAQQQIETSSIISTPLVVVALWTIFIFQARTHDAVYQQTNNDLLPDNRSPSFKQTAQP